MCDPILATLLKMRPHYSQSSRENATPSSGTSPSASYKEVPRPRRGSSRGALSTHFKVSGSIVQVATAVIAIIAYCLQVKSSYPCTNIIDRTTEKLYLLT